MQGISSNCDGSNSGSTSVAATIDGDQSTFWDPENSICATGSNDWWIKISLAAEQVVEAVGFFQHGGIIHDVLSYDFYICSPRPGLGVDPDLQNSANGHYLTAADEIARSCTTKLQTCSATNSISIADEQTCQGWGSATVGQHWALHITSLGRGVHSSITAGEPRIREINLYGFPAPPPPSPPPPPLLYLHLRPPPPSPSFTATTHHPLLFSTPPSPPPPSPPPPPDTTTTFTTPPPSPPHPHLHRHPPPSPPPPSPPSLPPLFFFYHYTTLPLSPLPTTVTARHHHLPTTATAPTSFPLLPPTYSLDDSSTIYLQYQGSGAATCFLTQTEPLSSAVVYTESGPTGLSWSYPDGVDSLPAFCGFEWGGNPELTGTGVDLPYQLHGTLYFASNPTQPHIVHTTVIVDYAPPPPPPPPNSPPPPLTAHYSLIASLPLLAA
ncbi:hypothetical protein CYMTET_50593 [Cymbomonas tetramitiformis]|uniref:F5/8 type C domain-containing protein n=1 Tax=Cymbomonas tetramitiformis TaxID=36881 RepID=A0AAE0ETB6_9CHLO|nr:hypothetical protein CYMTET_50593 [Cymbomonas tetramitiformis]